ncbi:MAG TPA: efflux RND transporter periplasmic adaptor subunit [Steroidobacteraceae bacterium]|jgi:membrane fusion protein (multidrug efflux system)|nr:efflux RND transporter periplasmic adaptor subunit [Steroidobacteraceae bacterium]
MLKPLIIMVLLVALVIGGVFGWQAFAGSMFKKFMAQTASAPQTVSTVVAKKSTWQAHISAIGSLRAVRGADLSAQASGVVDDIEFDSGNDVPQDKVLLKLRPNDDYAKLAQLEAAAELADQTLKRDREQFAAQAISQATIDTDVSTLKSANAQVVAQRALIEEKIVKAPFAGRLGIRQIDLGQYLAAGTTIVTLQALDPILIDFYVPQQALEHLRVGQTALATVDTYPGTTFQGTIESINSKVDNASRNVQVRASFKNADRRLVPGMFAAVAVDAGESNVEITLPQACITYNPYGDTVFVLVHGQGGNGKAQGTVEQHFVKLGPTRGDQVAILSGINEGDAVVSAGQIKLRNGSAVVVNNAVQPTDDAHPAPPNE